MHVIIKVALCMYYSSGVFLKSFLHALWFPEIILKFYYKPLNFILLGEVKEVVYLMYGNWHLSNISYP